MGTIVETFADFTLDTTFDALPTAVVSECKRIVLDSIACAVAAIDEPKGRAGIAYARGMLAGAPAAPKATIWGTGEQVSPLGAAWANGELINALDMDAMLPPTGHVTPYVLPGAVAEAEARGASGRDLITAIALSHEMSGRFGKCMDSLRDTKDGKVDPPPVFGYSSTVFGATAAIARMRGLDRKTTEHALGIAGCIAPVNSQTAWFQHAPSSTIKYLLAGALVQAAFSASYMAEYGHTGDRMVLDDAEFGFPRFIGSRRWAPGPLTEGLGDDWTFLQNQGYKPYPHCRILHALLDCLIEIVEREDLKPDEIAHVKVLVEGFVEQPVWLNREITNVHDAQFSIAHGIALGAHRLPPGRAWQDPAHVFDPSVLALMDRVEHQVHPDYVQLLTGNAASRPARIEVTARGQVFTGEKRYPKGAPSPDPASFMTDDELIAKFRGLCEGALPPSRIEAVIDGVMTLEDCADVSTLLRTLGPR
ncbi:MAG: MmgE/PrpD family protein [Rhodobacteraceae bacterium]|nr:MmgE/PrpD family protein [Paracoccaceae bacterium]